jgi:outer membrane biosynthesis protein TonB
MIRAVFSCILLWACAPQKPEPEAPDEPNALAPAATTATTATPAATETAAPKPPAATPSQKPVPPLSSPNPSAKPAAASEDAGPASGDPRTETLRRIGTIGQRCHEKHTPDVAGNFTLEIALDPDGKIEKTRVIGARSTQALVGGAFERCLLDGVKKERFPPPRGEEVVLDVPLSFKPGN